MHFILLIYLIIPPHVLTTVTIGCIANGMLTNNTDNLTRWLNTQDSETCLCYALILNGSVVALNVFSSGSCQLFFNYLLYKEIQINLNSTLYLLQPLPTGLSIKSTDGSLVLSSSRLLSF
ncbi:unnamed protein product [Didymodactylos carnosus]|uniref:Uncharacterized protein n=1 Tax=Didymodactylos carnosus TaxID=1234261 RepID=A0A814L515_9BILA|nr:unnamed protein product [Didymodactylos carnosus]CAF1179393.1 unnamed protein product [Didymodactylos carnosus]CAF3828060.1 unnamed protein product [Didymodactylos carnosus]CAF3990624.1 unnamed protein product [Didymodactylos carnosus]